MNLNVALHDGRNLQEVADDHPVLLLFLRHFGCIFCREAITDLVRLRAPLTARGIEVVVVHQGTEAEGRAFFQAFGADDQAAISDPERTLYHVFHLRRGNFRQMLGLKIWLRSADVHRHGLHQGKLMGDIWQMPGCFMVRSRQILAAYPYERASDRPDYLAFADAALARDVSQLSLLRPDGSLRPMKWPSGPLDARSSNASEPALPALHPRLWIVGGNGSAPARFARAIPLLHPRWNTQVLELAGQGSRSQAPLPDSLEGFARDLARELDRAAQEGDAGQPLFVYGHGIGGLVLAHALRFASVQPDAMVLHAPVGAFLARRRFPGLMRLPGVTRAARALLSHRLTGPRFAKRLLAPGSRADWRDRAVFAEGYGQASSFDTLFRVVDPIDALDGLEQVTCPTRLLWGAQDRVLSVQQLPAWAELLKHAPVEAHVEPRWDHYPYLDSPEAFVDVLTALLLKPGAHRIAKLEQAIEWHPRSKAGRMIAMRRAGLPTPDGWYVPATASEYEVARLAGGLSGEGPWSVRSSAALEDQAHTTGAGLFRTVLEVTRGGLEEAVAQVRASGPEGQCDVLIQPMVPRTAGGVAWARAIGADLEIGAGGAEAVVEGRDGLVRAWLSELGPPWRQIPDMLPGLLHAAALEEGLWPLLKRVHALFGVAAVDVEWCYHPQQGFTLLQARPLVPGLEPRRMLSTANIQEIIPPVPSALLVDSADAASARLPRYYARLDRRLAELGEPFTQNVEGHYLLNADLWAAIFHRWGLSTSLVSRRIGGSLPPGSFHLGRFLRSIPVFFRMLRDQSRVRQESARALDMLERQLPPSGEAGMLAGWLEQAYSAVVSGNFRITGIVTVPVWPFGPRPVTAEWAEDLRRLGTGAEEVLERWGHRGTYESDPAWPRGDHPAVRPVPRPRLPDPLSGLPVLWQRVPWLFPRYMRAHREWFRDASMRLWAAYRSRLMETAQKAVAEGHLEEADSIWALGVSALRQPPAQWQEALERVRRPSPSLPPPLFWSDTLAAVNDAPTSIVILRPGIVSGQAVVARTPAQALAAMRHLTGPIILIAPAVDPGWMEVFLKVSGIVTELGGRLSHAAVLIQEQMTVPAVFNLKGAMGLVTTGERVRLEIPPGRITRLDQPSEGNT